MTNRLATFETYEEFHGKRVFPILILINYVAIVLTLGYLPFDLYARGFTWDFVIVGGARVTVAFFIALLILSMKHPLFERYRIEGVTVFGTIAFCIGAFTYIVFDDRTYYVGYSWVYYVIATVLLAPLITNKMYLVMEIFQVSFVVFLMKIYRVPVQQLEIFLTFSIPFFLYGWAVVTINRKAAVEMYGNAHQNYFYMSIDGLSHLLNRRSWYDKGQGLFTQEKGLSFIMLDIDHFKRVNDTYGHECGDVVIEKISSVLLEQTRDYDLVGRLGGEEFGIILPHTDKHDALEIAQRIREAVEQLNISYEGNTLHVTVSIGVIENRAEIPNFGALVKLGDKCLYEAKERGRNQVVS